MKVWIDADACPKIIKDFIFDFCLKKNIPISLVANSYLKVPPHPLVQFIQVEKGADEADKYIVEQVKENEIVITADIPLASEVVKKDATAINPRGEIYTKDNVGERLSMRDFMQDLRDSGIETSGPPPITKKDKEKFANSFNQVVSSLYCK